MLKDLDLESRIINNLDLIQYNINDIDWNSVEIRLEKLKLISMNFLDQFFDQVLKCEKDKKKYD